MGLVARENFFPAFVPRTPQLRSQGFLRTGIVAVRDTYRDNAAICWTSWLRTTIRCAAVETPGVKSRMAYPFVIL